MTFYLCHCVFVSKTQRHKDMHDHGVYKIKKIRKRGRTEIEKSMDQHTEVSDKTDTLIGMF